MQGNFLKKGKDTIAIDEVISMDLNSPFFDRDEVILSDGENINPRGAVTQPFTKVSAGEVAKLVGHIDKLQAKDQPRVTEGWSLISDGIRIDTGNLQITQMEANLNRRDTKYSFNFFSGNTDTFLNAIGDKTLKSLAMDGVRTVQAAADAITDWGNIQPASGANPMLGSNLAMRSGFGANPIPSNIAYNDVFADGGWAQHAATAKYCSDIVTADADEYICFPTLIVYTGDKNDLGESLYRVVNRWDLTGRFLTYESAVRTVDNDTYTEYTPLENPIVPMYYYHQVLRHVFSEHGYTLNDDWLLEDSQFLKKAFVNTYNILRPLVVYMTNIHNAAVDGNTLYYEQKTYIDPKNHLSDLSIIDFLRDFMLKYCCYFDINGTEVTIVHQDIDKAQREIADYNPNIIIETPAETGVMLKYDLVNESYATENAAIKKTADFSIDDYTIDEELNFVTETTGGAVVCNNVVPYNTGKAKEYSMPVTPVNCKIIDYTNVLRGVSFGTGIVVDTLLPFVNSSIGGYGLTTFEYEWASAYDFIGMTAWTSDHTYNFVSVDTAVEESPEDMSIVGFYHGLGQTLDLFSYVPEYPYMSNHNYQPGAVTPKIGDWHLGIIGAEGLVDTFYGSFMNIFNNNRKFVIAVKEDYDTMRKHRYNQSVIIRGTKLYVGIMKPRFPLRGRYTFYDCWEV